jgi:ATP-binding cassette subfamily C exporter for protease/lipase
MKTQTQISELRAAVTRMVPTWRRASVFSVVASLLALAPSLYMLEVYDRVVNSRNYLTLAMLTVAVLGALVVMEVIEWARAEMIHDAGVQLDRELGGRVFDAIFTASLRRAPGGTAHTLNDLRTVREFFGLAPVNALMETPAALVMVVLLFAISPILGWVSVVGAVVQVGLGWLNERATQPPLALANRSAIQAQLYADNTLRNAQVIEAMGMLRDIHGRWIAKQREFLSLQAVASDGAGVYAAWTKLLQNILSSGLLGLGAWLLLQNDLNGGAGMMIVGSILGGRMLAPLVQIVVGWRAFVNFREAWARLEQLLEAVPLRAPSMKLPAPKGAVSVEQVVAAAPGSNFPILKGVHFALQPGEVLGVVGPSASGKTTLARLLTGIWPAQQGKVRLDGADVALWDKLELGPNVGYLPQGVELLEGTVAENIARFGELEPAKIEAAGRAVGLHELILDLPDGYDTPVGRDGAVLSGGQRQRVALARALYGDPAFVVLDEPNSSLDEEGDAALSAAIASMKARGTTFVVMTHRTSVLAVVDKLLVLRDGQMQAFGPRDEVLAAIAKAAQQAQQPPQPAQAARGGARPLATTAT